MRTKIDPSIVISLQGKVVYYNGIPVDKQTLQQWKEEIHLYKRMSFFTSLQETLRQHAIRTGLYESQSWDHVLAAKALMTRLNLEQEWIEIIEKA